MPRQITVIKGIAFNAYHLARYVNMVHFHNEEYISKIIYILKEENYLGIEQADKILKFRSQNKDSEL